MNTVNLTEHNASWSEQFEEIKTQLTQSVGKWCSQIEHIGSTAIPGIVAKPTIDVLIGVNSLNDADKLIVPRIQKLGYNYIADYEKDAPYRRYFEKLDNQGNHLVHIHLVPLECEFWNRMIFFRDYLRKHPSASKKYEKIKLSLAKSSTSREEYTQGKSAFVQSIEKNNARRKHD